VVAAMTLGAACIGRLPYTTLFRSDRNQGEQLMPEIIVKSAFVDKVLAGKDGAFGLRTSEPHSRKNDQGGYDTTGRTFRTLRGRRSEEHTSELQSRETPA